MTANHFNTTTTPSRMRLSRIRRASILAVGFVTALTAAIAVPAATGVASASPTPGLPSHVRLDVTAPTPGQVVTGDSLALTVFADHYELDAFYAGTPVSRHVGHYHEILDGNLVDMTPLHDPNHDSISMVGVTPGPHTLTIVPANNDHSMIMSAAVNIPFTYAGPYLAPPAGLTGTPGIAITSPANGSTVSGNSFSMTADVTNFALCGNCFGKANVAGEGHWHIFADAPVMPTMLTMAGDVTQEVPTKGLPTGWHTFWAVLVTNQHMPIMPMTMTPVFLYVQHSAVEAN